ncbi:MAG: Single-stranded DNA-binding protein [Microgenomates bacterium OLB23]|nr:MAG: Single-stranded DNA-binding protein [Microgenomates bacterium OLB23]
MASRSLNRVVLIGNLTRDPELKYTPQGTAVCSFGVATNRSWTTKTGDTKEDVQFHRIVAWQKLAELAANLLSKGRKIYLEGRITYRSFEGKDGQQKQITEIIMDDFVLFDDRRKGTSDDAPDHQEEDMSMASAADHDEPMPESAETAHNEKVDPDDIPF